MLQAGVSGPVAGKADAVIHSQQLLSTCAGEETS